MIKHFVSVKKVKKNTVFIWVIFIVTIACNNNRTASGDRELARVSNKYLYESDLENIIPPGTDINDSIVIVKNYIDTWILNQLLIEKAENNLPGNEKNFDQQLENYRNSLLIYAYESKLVSQTLDTIISPDELQLYYDDNIQNFTLHDHIVQVVWAMFEADAPYLKDVNRFFYSDEESDYDSLLIQFEDNAEEYFTADHLWIEWSVFGESVPINPSSVENYLIRNKKDTLKHDDYLFYIVFRDYRIKNDHAPLEMVTGNIRQIVLNKRKRSIINQMQKEIFQQALANNEIEIY